MTLRELEYLIALADHRHFGRAAEMCRVSQPTLSTQLRKLEAELGASLIERGGRSVVLTPFGHDAVGRARRILTEAEEMRKAARQAQDPETGTLRLGIFPTLGPYLLPHVVPRIREQFPALETMLVEDKSDQLIQRLREGSLDAAILALPIEDERLQVESLFEERFLLAVPSEHQLAHKNSVSLNDLRGQDLMLLEEGHCLRQQALDICRLSGAAEQASFKATSLETLRQMVAADIGMTLLPELAATYTVSANIKLMGFDGQVPSRRVAMAWRLNSGMNDFLQRVAALLQDVSARLLEMR